MNIVPLFPTAVGVFNLQKFTKTQINFIKNVKTRPNEGNITSEDNYIFKNKTLKNISDFCLDCANQYFNEIYAPKNNLKLYITQSWINFASKDQYHHKHEHPNSIVSGVLYVDADEPQDKIVFHKTELYKTIHFGIEAKDYNPFNSNSWWLPIKSNDLLIFPSSLSHSVPKLKTEKTRISISFNTFIKGNLGNNVNLTELILD